MILWSWHILVNFKNLKILSWSNNYKHDDDDFSSCWHRWEDSKTMSLFLVIDFQCEHLYEAGDSHWKKAWLIVVAQLLKQV